MNTGAIAIWGAGGFAREVLQLVEDAREDGARLEFVGFLDGNAELHGTEVHGYPVLGNESWLANNPSVHVAIGVGNPVFKHRILRSVEAAGHERYATLRHPRAWLGRNVNVDAGSIICAGVMITTDVTIGRHVILNLNTTVGHDAVLDDFVTVAPGVQISGSVHVGTGTDLGTGASVIQGVAVGAWSIVGAGSVVVADLPSNVTAVGVPAKPIKTRDDGWQLR